MKLTVLKVEKHERHNSRRPRDFWKKPIIYFAYKDESIFENFGNRAARPVDLYRKVIPEVLKAVDLPETTKVNWSQKAGCSCGCSPGFIVQTPAHFDIWVTVGGPKREQSEAADAVASARTLALMRDPTIAPILLGLKTPQETANLLEISEVLTIDDLTRSD